MPVMTKVKVRESSLLSYRDKLEYQKFAYLNFLYSEGVDQTA